MCLLSLRLATSQRVRLVCAIGSFGVTICVSLYPQQNLLECGCPHARAAVRRRGPPRDAGANEIVLSRKSARTGTGPTRHTAGGGRGAGGGTAPANRMIMDICWYRLPCGVPSDPGRFWLYVAASTASKHGRRLQDALVTYGDACSSRTVLRKVEGVATDRSAVRRASRSVHHGHAAAAVHHGHAAAAARRARGRPRRVAVGPRPSRPELSVRTPPGAPAHRAGTARSAPGPARTVGSAVERALPLDLRARCRRGIRSY